MKNVTKLLFAITLIGIVPMIMTQAPTQIRLSTSSFEALQQNRFNTNNVKKMGTYSPINNTAQFAYPNNLGRGPLKFENVIVLYNNGQLTTSEMASVKGKVLFSVMKGSPLATVGYRYYGNIVKN